MNTHLYECISVLSLHGYVLATTILTGYSSVRSFKTCMTCVFSDINLYHLLDACDNSLTGMQTNLMCCITLLIECCYSHVLATTILTGYSKCSQF